MAAKSKRHTTKQLESDFFKLTLGGGASDISRDTHFATCHELVFLKSYLAYFTNTTRVYFNLEISLNRFGNVTGTPQVPTLKNPTIASYFLSKLLPRLYTNLLSNLKNATLFLSLQLWNAISEVL